MSVDSHAFRRALGQFASGVTIVTTRNATGRPLGLTVSAFCSVSLHPPLVLVCVDHGSELNVGVRESGLFAVSVLREDQEHVSRHFARRGGDKFASFEATEAASGVPLVPGALAQLQCRVRSFHGEGDHTVWVGEVVTAATRPGRPLLYHAGTYYRLHGEE